MTIAQLARTLGYAGLLPFLALSLAAWLKLPLLEAPHDMLMGYGAVILSFMGAVHWGLAMARQQPIATTQLGLSVVPPLLGWLALLLHPLWGYSVLIVSFAGLCMADRRAFKQGLVPDWYASLRVILTTVVVLCLVAAQLAWLLG